MRGIQGGEIQPEAAKAEPDERGACVTVSTTQKSLVAWGRENFSGGV